MSPRNLVAIFFLMVAIGLSSAATIPITNTTNLTFIQWNWTSGYNVTDIAVDGDAKCGFETMDPGYLATGLSCGSLHTISIFTNESDTGYAATYTLSENCTSGTGGVNQTQIDDTMMFNEGTAAAFGIVGGLVTSVLILRRRKGP